MQKKFLGNLFFIQILNLLIKAVWILFIDLAVQNSLGPEKYGDYYIVLNFCLVFILILDLGLNNYNAKNIAEDSGFIVNKKSIILLKLVLSIIYFGFVLSIGLTRDYNIFFLLLLVANQIILSFVQYYRSNLAGMHYFIKDGVVGVTDKFVAVVICIGLFFSDNITIEVFIVAQTFGLVSALLLGFTFNLNNKKRVFDNKQIEILTIVKSAFPFALLMALMVMYTRIDTVMLDLMISNPHDTEKGAEFHAGIYAQSFRLLDAGNIFALILSGMLLPIFSRMLKNGEKPNKIVALSAKLIAIPTLWVVQVAFFFGFYILGYLYRFESDIERLYSSTVFASLMIAFVAMSLVYVYGTLLTAANKIKRLNALAAICLGINIVLNYFLIKQFNVVGRPAEGAAIATFVTQWIFVALCIRECYSLFSLKIEWRFIGKLVAFLGILAAIYFYLVHLNYEIRTVLIIYLLCTILFLFLFRLVDFKKAISLILTARSNKGNN